MRAGIMKEEGMGVLACVCRGKLEGSGAWASSL